MIQNTAEGKIIKKLQERKKRGQTTKENDKKYLNLPNLKLISLLDNNDPQIRTSAANILGRRKYSGAIASLCNRLSKEKYLYSKIAIQHALIDIGEPIMPELIKYIGKIGNNQHKKLPTNSFKKWNYPCARDIAIRTICNIGRPALSYLQKIFNIEEVNIKSEIIDGIGYISFYAKDISSFDLLINNFEENPPLLKWKLIRAFSAFPLIGSVDLLTKYILSSEYSELRWEAARSLGVIKDKKCKEALKEALKTESNLLVIEMIKLSICKIKN